MHKQGTTEKKGKQIHVMDSSHSDSPNNQSGSWECPPSKRKHLIPDLSIIYDRGASSRSTKKFIQTTIAECSEKVVEDSVDVAEMEEVSENENSVANNSVGQSSPILDTVEGHQVRPELVPVVRKILTKHGDVFENSTISTMTFRSMLLEMICDIISDLQDNDLHKITEDEVCSMIGLANGIKEMKVDIEWLHLRLEEILEARQFLKQSGILKEKKYINKKIIKTVKRELEQCEAEKKAVKAKFQSICDRESACKETLARAQDESVRISQTITNAKSKVRHFVNCSLAEGLL